MSTEDKFINLYSPVSYHDEQYIVADKASLEKLQKAIAEALKEGVGVQPVWASDGEGHGLVVVLDEHVDNVQVAYRHDWSSDDTHVPNLKEEAHSLLVKKLQGLWT